MTSRRATLAKHFKGPNTVLRPILTSLNGDNSWLISLPRPTAERQTSVKAYYHVVSDVWLSGPFAIFSKWLVSVGLPTEPAIADINGIKAVITEIEDAAEAAGAFSKPTSSTGSSKTLEVDAIFVNFHYNDHMDEKTLKTFSPDVPVFAAPEAAKTVQSWKHFDRVVTTNDITPADTDWRKLHPGSPLPSWLNVFRLVGHRELNFATAIVISPSEEQHEVILYSPHSIRTDQPSLQTFLRATPQTSTLAMLHALQSNFGWGYRFTLGAEGGLALERLVKPKYWIRSHWAALRYEGLFLWGVKDVLHTLDWALGREKEERLAKGEKEDLAKPNFIEVENGGCFVLE
jgi:hypothetical protein